MIAQLERLDHWLFFAINNNWSTPILDQIFWAISTFGNGTGMFVGGMLLLWFIDRDVFKRHWVGMALAVLAGAVVMQALKYGLARPRPLSAFAPLLESGEVQINVIGRALRQRSFPSGHAQAAASVLAYFGCLYPRYWLGWGVGILLAALGRIYVGVHFPSDVIAGSMLGAFSAILLYRMRTHVVEGKIQNGRPSDHL